MTDEDERDAALNAGDRVRFDSDDPEDAARWLDAHDGGDVDVSGYTVTFTLTILGWRWDATDPDGEAVPSPPRTVLTLTSPTRRQAEEHALLAIERHATPNPPLDGEELRRRVRAREGDPR